MGYILPIQPIQSQQYANRMNMESYNFAYVDRVNKVRFDFSDSMNDSFQREQEMKEEKEMPIVSAPPVLYKGFVYPNPANLSPAIAQVVGKGLNVNAYV